MEQERGVNYSRLFRGKSIRGNRILKREGFHSRAFNGGTASILWGRAFAGSVMTTTSTSLRKPTTPSRRSQIFLARMTSTSSSTQRFELFWRWNKEIQTTFRRCWDHSLSSEEIIVTGFLWAHQRHCEDAGRCWEWKTWLDCDLRGQKWSSSRRRRKEVVC